MQHTSNNNENIVQEIMGLIDVWSEHDPSAPMQMLEKLDKEANDARALIESKLHELVQELEASQAQHVPQLDLSDAGLTAIYKKANNEVGKARPLTTESIFRAMRAVAALSANMKL